MPPSRESLRDDLYEDTIIEEDEEPEAQPPAFAKDVDKSNREEYLKKEEVVEEDIAKTPVPNDNDDDDTETLDERQQQQQDETTHRGVYETTIPTDYREIQQEHAEEEDTMTEADESPAVSPNLNNRLSFSPSHHQSTPPRPVEAPPPPPAAGAGAEYPNMSRQSVLEAFENDLKDLLLLEGKSALNPNMDPAATAQPVSQTYESPKSAYHSNSNSTSNASHNGFRFSRSTISSYGGQDVTELDIEDPKSPASNNSSNLNKPLPPIDATFDNETDHPPPMPLNSATSNTNIQQQQQLYQHNHSRSGSGNSKKLSRMSSDVESKIKRGRVSLRRKSAATLRLSTLNFHNNNSSPPKDSNPLPANSVQMVSATATFDTFLNPDNYKNAAPAVYPENHEEIPLWFLRQVLASKSNTCGAYLSESLFVASDLWSLDTVNAKVLDPRIICLKELTKLAADYLHTSNCDLNVLTSTLDSLESAFNSAFITPLDGDVVEPMASPRRSSTTTISHNPNGLAPTFSHTTQAPSIAAQSNSTSSSRASGVFKRLRKKSMIGMHTDNNISGSPPMSEPQTPTEPSEKTTLDSYLSALSSLAAALESVQQRHHDQNSQDQSEAKWLKTYRCFVAHVACRLILKDITILQDIYKAEFREYLGK